MDQPCHSIAPFAIAVQRFGFGDTAPVPPCAQPTRHSNTKVHALCICSSHASPQLECGRGWARGTKAHAALLPKQAVQGARVLYGKPECRKERNDQGDVQDDGANQAPVATSCGAVPHAVQLAAHHVNAAAHCSQKGCPQGEDGENDDDGGGTFDVVLVRALGAGKVVPLCAGQQCVRGALV